MTGPALAGRRGRAMAFLMGLVFAGLAGGVLGVARRLAHGFVGNDT